ncbi:hypothetical protein GCM10010972_33590 [Cellulomonas carbonis]|nr:hypothetical protein GCM10010972_33590 [Cellulomonas carbonis]
MSSSVAQHNHPDPGKYQQHYSQNPNKCTLAFPGLLRSQPRRESIHEPADEIGSDEAQESRHREEDDL